MQVVGKLDQACGQAFSRWAFEVMRQPPAFHRWLPLPKHWGFPRAAAKPLNSHPLGMAGSMCELPGGQAPASDHVRDHNDVSGARGYTVGSVIKKRRKRMAKKKHRKLLKRTRIQRRRAGKCLRPGHLDGRGPGCPRHRSLARSRFPFPLRPPRTMSRSWVST